MDYTSTKVLESLTEDNALELGIFGETHNSSVILNASARFIMDHLTVKTLPDGWEQQLQPFPRLMLAIIGAGRKEVQEAKYIEIKMDRSQTDQEKKGHQF